MSSPLSELYQFLTLSTRLDLKVVALQHVLGLTGSPDGVKLITEALNGPSCPLLSHLLLLLNDPNETVSKDAALALINLSANEDVVKILLEMNMQSDPPKSVVAHLWSKIEDKDCFIADPACMILSNLTINKVNCDKVYQELRKAEIELGKIIFVFCQEGYNTKGAKLHYLGPFLSNLSQLSDVRKAIVDRECCVIQRLLSYTEYKSSKVRRGGIIGTLRNCCFDTDQHEWLLSDEVDILPRLLLPLCGPTPDDLPFEEVEQLPIDLQYLEEDKEVEEDPDLRKMLLEAITQLCAMKTGREILRKKNIYFLLRELHKKEEDKTVKLACENLVDIIIKKEEEINLENYKDVDVPNDVVQELEDMDKDYLKE